MVVLGGLPFENAGEHAGVHFLPSLGAGIFPVDHDLAHIWENALDQSLGDRLEMDESC